MLRRKKKREKREKNRQRDGGKEGRPAATRGKGGETRGKEKRGKGVHNRPAHACIDEDFVTLAHKEGRGARREAPAPADPPRRKTRSSEKKREPQGEHARPKTDATEPHRQNKNKNANKKQNRPQNIAHKRRTNDKQTRKPNIE